MSLEKPSTKEHSKSRALVKSTYRQRYVRTNNNKKKNNNNNNNDNDNSNNDIHGRFALTLA